MKTCARLKYETCFDRIPIQSFLNDTKSPLHESERLFYRIPRQTVSFVKSLNTYDLNGNKINNMINNQNIATYFYLADTHSISLVPSRGNSVSMNGGIRNGVGWYPLSPIKKAVSLSVFICWYMLLDLNITSSTQLPGHIAFTCVIIFRALHIT